MNAHVETGRFKQDLALTAAPKLNLTPSQATTCEKLEVVMAATSIVALAGNPGSGRSTVLRYLADKYGGKIVSMQEVMAGVTLREAGASEDAIGAVVMRMLERASLVLVDDLTSLSFSTMTTRAAYFNIVLKHLYATVIAQGKKLVVAGRTPESYESGATVFGESAAMVVLPDFTLVDYQAIAADILGKEKAKGIDFKLVYRFASLLNGHQLRMACNLIAGLANPSAESMIDCLIEGNVVSANTRIDQVEALSFDSLPGHEHITSRLETHIILPLENRVLAQKLGLKPKRGVLLYGPPGTGKTSIGRALAHRMKGKFFLIDGSFISEPPGMFFGQLAKVVAEAKENSPSVLFIDDADVLFTIEHIAGLARYLLSLLDGLESETASNVCVMMTAMDVRKVPEALLRSGRVELWLETKLPTEETRGRILERWMGSDLPGYEAIDYQALAKATDGFTPADLRRIAGDAKALYAADRIKNRRVETGTQYVERAVGNIVVVRNRMADSLDDETLRVGEEYRKGKYAMGSGGTASIGGKGSECGW